MAKGFHPLTVSEVRRETPDAVSVAFDVPPALADAFRFEPGQYLTLRATVDGERLRRTYSICTVPDAGELRVAVKRMAGGRFSAFVNERLAPGDTLDVMAPVGRFVAGPAPSGGRTCLGVAAGSGITPVIAILETILTREPASRFVLLYGNRTAGDIIFKQRLDDLKDRFVDRLAVVHVLSRERHDVEILNGRLDGPKIEALVRRLVPGGRVDEAFLCGPAGLTEAAEAALLRLGVAPERIRAERFTPAEDAVGRRPVAAAERAGALAGPEVEVTLDGIRHALRLLPDEAIIDGAIRVGLDLPWSCKGGMCCTCRAKLVGGEVAMRECWGLEPWEVAAGYVLTCQSVPRTARVAVDYDQV